MELAINIEIIWDQRQEVTMRMIVVAAMATIAIGLAGAPSTSAAPINAGVINNAATATSPVTKVPCRWRSTCGPRGCVKTRRCW